MMLTQEDLCLRMNKYVLKSWNERKENELRAHLLVLKVQGYKETGNGSQGKTVTPAIIYILDIKCVPRLA